MARSTVTATVALAAFVLLSTAHASTAEKPTTTRLIPYSPTNYTNWRTNVTYMSSSGYDAQGMAPLYRITNWVLNWFVGEIAIPEGYIIPGKTPELGPLAKNNQWGDLARHYWGVILIVVLTALLIVLMPIIGLCFCCCRCAGACGGRSQPFDKKHDTCRRGFLGLLLLVAGTALIFGVVVAFVTNSYLQNGVENATVSARYAVDDTQKFLKTTSYELNHLLTDNYDELSLSLQKTLNETGVVVVNKLDTESKAVSLTKLTNFVEALPDIVVNLVRMKDITNGLRVNASQLNDGLRGVKRELLVSLTKCPAAECKTVLDNYSIGKLDVNGIDYNQIPDLTSKIADVESLINNKILTTISNGQNALDTMKQDLIKTIDDSVPKVIQSLNQAGTAIKDVNHQITESLQRISDVVGNNSYKYFDEADNYIDEYSMYRFYVGIGVSSVLLLVLLCITFGLLCGICGKRPDGYGDDCCNKGAGSRFLMLGVAVIFLTISILAATSLVIYLAGLVLHRGLCMPMADPANDQIFGYLDKMIDLNEVMYPDKVRATKNNMEPFRISDVIVDCHKDKTVYEVLRIHNIMDIEEIRTYPQKYQISQKLENLIDDIKIDADTTILSAQAEKDIIKLSESELNNFEFYQFADNLNDTITAHNLTEIADRLTKTAETIAKSSDMTDVRISLRNQALHLRTYQDNLVTPMTEQTKEMLQLAKKLEQTLKFGDDSFQKSIMNILDEVKHAQSFITANGLAFVKNVTQELFETFTEQINIYLNLVITTTKEGVGKCQPLSNVYNSMMVATCNRIIDPFNGFWAGVGWCVLIFLPALILSVKLSSLYQKSDPYPGPLVESEYLYDAYSERDNIPLSNSGGPKNKRRKNKNNRRQGSRDRRERDYYEDSGSPHGPPTGGPRDARYNDMAPKHWDGGPPRYQNAPIAPPASEYERPPPYYYPGAPTDD